MLRLAPPYTCPHSLLPRVLGLPQRVEIDKRPDKKFRQGFTGAPAAAGREEQEQTTGSLAPSLTGWRCGWGMVSLFLCGMYVAVCPGFPGGSAIKNPFANATDTV